MQTCIVIPARMASTRLPQKPLQDIGGVPMVVRVVQQMQGVGADAVVVAVDHQSVFEVVEQAGFDVMMTSTDHASGSDRVMEVAQRLRLAAHDVVINVQGDEPLMPVDVVQNLQQLMKQHQKIDLASVSEPVTEVADYLNPNVVKVVTDRAGRALYFSRAPIPFVRDKAPEQLNPADLQELNVRRHVGVYAFRVGALSQFVELGSREPDSLESIEMLEQLRWLQAGHSIQMLASEQLIPGGVDTQEDLERVRGHFTPQ